MHSVEGGGARSLDRREELVLFEADMRTQKRRDFAHRPGVARSIVELPYERVEPDVFRQYPDDALHRCAILQRDHGEELLLFLAEMVHGIRVEELDERTARCAALWFVLFGGLLQHARFVQCV